MNHTVTPMLNIGRIVAVITLVALLATAIHACSNNYSNATSATNKSSVSETALPTGAKQVEATNGRIVVVRAMDDPDNPYKDEYKPWDYWFYDHLLTEIPIEKLWSELSEDEKAERIAKRKAGMGWLRQRHHLDKDGFIIPDSRSIKEFKEGICINTYQERSINLNWVMAEGEIDPNMHQAMWDAGYVESSRFYPDIPKWLADNPPYEAILLPNGDVVTRGLLGDYDKHGDEIDCCGGQGQIIARYDNSGNLVRTLREEVWFYLYYDTDLNPVPEGMPSISLDGYTTFRDESTGRLLSVWDWDGTQLKTEEPTWRDPHPFTWLNAKRLQILFNAVHE